MLQCEVCGNSYHRAFTLIYQGKEHTFDSFECAIHALAPVCDHCGCKIIGHGHETKNQYFCCAHCAREMGVTELADHAGSTSRG